MANSKKTDRRSDFKPVDLSGFSDERARFDSFLKEKVRSKEEIEQLLRQFDKEQRDHWSDNTFRDKQ